MAHVEEVDLGAVVSDADQVQVGKVDEPQEFSIRQTCKNALLFFRWLARPWPRRKVDVPLDKVGAPDDTEPPHHSKVL